MITESVLVLSILTMIALGIVTTGLILVHASLGDARARQLAAPLDEGRRILATALSSNTALSAEERQSLGGLPRDRVIGLVRDVVQSFRGDDSDTIRSLARDLDIVDLAAGLVKSRLWWRRLEGTRLLALFDEGRHLRPRLLDDRHPLVRSRAAEWTARDATEAEIQTLVRLLSDRDGLTRHSAKDALIRLGTDATPVVALGLASANGDDAVPLLEVAAAINDPRLLAGALRLVADDDPRARSLATRLLGTLGGADALDRLGVLLDDPDPQVRAAAAEGLGRLGYWPLGSQLAARLEDSSWDVRFAAGIALRAIGGPGLLLLRRATGSADDFAADMARQILDLRDLDEVAW